eukprot:Rmarinus@m.12149
MTESERSNSRFSRGGSTWDGLSVSTGASSVRVAAPIRRIPLGPQLDAVSARRNRMMAIRQSVSRMDLKSSPSSECSSRLSFSDVDHGSSAPSRSGLRSFGSSRPYTPISISDDTSERGSTWSSSSAPRRASRLASTSSQLRNGIRPTSHGDQPCMPQLSPKSPTGFADRRSKFPYESSGHGTPNHVSPNSSVLFLDESHSPHSLHSPQSPTSIDTSSRSAQQAPNAFVVEADSIYLDVSSASPRRTRGSPCQTSPTSDLNLKRGGRMRGSGGGPMREDTLTFRSQSDECDPGADPSMMYGSPPHANGSSSRLPRSVPRSHRLAPSSQVTSFNESTADIIPALQSNPLLLDRLPSGAMGHHARSTDSRQQTFPSPPGGAFNEKPFLAGPTTQNGEGDMRLRAWKPSSDAARGSTRRARERLRERANGRESERDRERRQRVASTARATSPTMQALPTSKLKAVPDLLLAGRDDSRSLSPLAARAGTPERLRESIARSPAERRSPDPHSASQAAQTATAASTPPGLEITGKRDRRSSSGRQVGAGVGVSVPVSVRGVGERRKYREESPCSDSSLASSASPSTASVSKLALVDLPASGARAVDYAACVSRSPASSKDDDLDCDASSSLADRHVKPKRSSRGSHQSSHSKSPSRSKAKGHSGRSVSARANSSERKSKCEESNCEGSGERSSSHRKRGSDEDSHSESDLEKGSRTRENNGTIEPKRRRKWLRVCALSLFVLGIVTLVLAVKGKWFTECKEIDCMVS